MLFLYIKICYRFVFLKKHLKSLVILNIKTWHTWQWRFHWSKWFLFGPTRQQGVWFFFSSIWKQSSSCLSHSALDMSGGSCSTTEERCWGLEQTGGGVLGRVWEFHHWGLAGWKYGADGVMTDCWRERSNEATKLHASATLVWSGSYRRTP